MVVKVGIPRALLFYYYFPMWREFFRTLGVETVVSGPSTKSVLNEGIQLSVEDACLPVKLALGHVHELIGKVDYLFLPRMVSVASREYICPKFLGFPDVVRQTVPGLPPVIDVNIDMYNQENGLFKALYKTGRFFTSNFTCIYLAYKNGLAALQSYRNCLEKGFMPDEAMDLTKDNAVRDPVLLGRFKEDLRPVEEKPVVAVIGHPYNIYDSCISMNIMNRLNKAGVKVMTTDQVPENVVRKEAESLPKKLFWTLSQRVIGSAYYFLHNGNSSGLLHVTSFGCGPDSMTGELITRRARGSVTVPLLNLVLDEHTGEAGMLTRLEAFLDMVNYKNAK